MACGLVLDPRQDFPAWLSTQGVNSHVAQAVERELGIGDYEALLACAESAQVRSELFVLARERLSFATYAVLRRAIEGLASRRSDAVDVAQGLEALGLQPFLSGLLDSMVVLLTSVSQDLSHSAQRLRSLEPTLYGEVAEATSSLSQGYAVSDPGVTTGPEDMYRYDVVEEEEDESLVDQKPPANYAEECNEIGAVEQQIPEASLNEQMIEDESQTIGSIVGRSSEHLLDVGFVKREPSAVGDGGIDDLKTKRKRFRLEPEARKRSVDKILWDTRNKNTTSSNHLVPDKRMKPDGACCPKRCMESVHYDHRRQLFDTFWRMTNKIEQDLFLCSSVSEMPVQRHYNKAKPQLSRRQHTRCYSFSLETGPVQVCKLLFLGTLGISSGRLDRALKRQKIPSVEMSHPLDVYPKYFASVSSCPPQILPKPSATW